jgi:SAM-dependent methyltransferase
VLFIGLYDTVYSAFMSAAPEREVDEPLQVTFSPPLRDRRILWILDHLQRERVREVLDVGCADGDMLARLCNAPPWLPDPPPEDILPASSRAPESGVPDFTPCDPCRLIGLDLSKADLERAIAATAPREAPEAAEDHKPPWMLRRDPRWTTLEVSLWHGSLAAPNAAFAGIECITASEVCARRPPARPCAAR